MTTTIESLLELELAAVRGEQVRIDGKCSTLAGLAGAALVYLVGQKRLRRATSLLAAGVLGIATAMLASVLAGVIA